MGVEELRIASDRTVLYSRDFGTIYIAEGGTGSSPSDRPKSPSPAVRDDVSGKWYMPWGDDNLWPQFVVEESSKSDQIASLISWKVKTLISGGLIYGNLEFDDQGNERLVPFYDEEITRFMKASALKRYQREAASDYYWFNNFFPEIILSNDRSKVASITVQEATYSRYAPQDKTTGLSPFVFVSANWDKSPSIDDVAKIPLIDPYYDPAETLRNAKGFRFMYTCSFPSPGKFFYQDADWHGIFKSGWLEIEVAVPKSKLAILKNQVSIKYP